MSKNDRRYEMTLAALKEADEGKFVEHSAVMARIAALEKRHHQATLQGLKDIADGDVHDGADITDWMDGLE